MPEAQRIAELVRSTYEGDAKGEAWHGPALKPLLQGVTAAQAAQRPAAGKHSIWELVLHIANWEGVSVRRLAGQRVEFDFDTPGDWPRITETSEAAWHAALQRLEQNNKKLRETIAACSAAQLEEKAVNRDFTHYVALHGIVHHGIYHAGQIAILKRALRPVV